ncbi:MAG: radical SAM family heme chaperone HemW [Muribaculum sp.]|nr:radical SAM family heme chaperone HemW [Muribaculum sp.]
MAGLYIHIPLCHSKCAYCDFHSFPENSGIGRYVRDRYISALLNEFSLRRHELTEPIQTIYIGGGTPSILTTEELRHLTDSLPLDYVSEFTIEANPEDVTPEWVQTIVDSGINRVSIGVQSLNDNELNAVMRRHSGADAIRAINLLADGGIKEISADLIYGLPGQTISSWENSIDGLLATPITHLSAYSLMYEPGTRLTTMLNAGKLIPVDENDEQQMYRMLTEKTSSVGMIHYEISNFAYTGHTALHNSNYWNMTPYLGLGPGAHSFDGNSIRRYNPTDSRRYVDSLSKECLIYEEENETPSDRLNDLIITALRTSHGLNLAIVEQMFGNDATSSLIMRAQPYIDKGMLNLTDNTILRIPERYWLISNSILRDILA